VQSAALASWLLDPNIDGRIRVQRSFAFRYEGLSQQIKFARSGGMGQALAQTNQRLETVVARAIAIGYQEVVNRHGDRIGLGQIMPSATEIIGQTLNEEPVYRMLSAVAHAHPWALQQTSFRRPVEGDIVVPDPVLGERAMPTLVKHLEPASVDFLCRTSLLALAWPIRARFADCFWDSSAPCT